jgi:hypothetical protein
VRTSAKVRPVPGADPRKSNRHALFNRIDDLLRKPDANAKNALGQGLPFEMGLAGLVSPLSLYLLWACLHGVVCFFGPDPSR